MNHSEELFKKITNEALALDRENVLLKDGLERIIELMQSEPLEDLDDAKYLMYRITVIAEARLGEEE